MTLALAVFVGLSAVFVYAGLSKIVVPDPLVVTFEQLGWRRLAHRRVVRCVGVGETVIAASIAFGGLFSATLVAGSALSFAIAGITAHQRPAPIACSCFAGLNGTLGLRQLVVLPGWLAASWLLATTPVTAAETLTITSIATIAAALVAAANLTRDAAQLRELRLAVGPLGGDRI